MKFCNQFVIVSSSEHIWLILSTLTMLKDDPSMAAIVRAPESGQVVGLHGDNALDLYSLNSAMRFIHGTSPDLPRLNALLTL